MTVEIGEKYLKIKIVGHEPIAAFLNKDKKSEKEPDFKASGIAVWVNKKKPEVQKVSSNELGL